jgi:hypothetical protein
MIPDYAMVHIEPTSNYKCYSLDASSTLYEVLNIKYNKMTIESLQDWKLINEALYFTTLLIEVLNKDEDS